MTYFYYLFRNTAMLLLTVLEILLLVRALISWFPQIQGSKLHQIVHMVTEPILLPFRNLLRRIPGIQGFPLDLSFLLAYMVLIMVQSVI